MRTHVTAMPLQGVKLIQGLSRCAVKFFCCLCPKAVSLTGSCLPLSRCSILRWMSSCFRGTWDSFIVRLRPRPRQTFLRLHSSLSGASFNLLSLSASGLPGSQAYPTPLSISFLSISPNKVLHIKFHCSLCQKTAHKWPKAKRNSLFPANLLCLIYIASRDFFSIFSRKTAWTLKIHLGQFPTLWTVHIYLEDNFQERFEKAF